MTLQKIAWNLYWAPNAQLIGVAFARTRKGAIRLAPKPYNRYKGEIYALEAN